MEVHTCWWRRVRCFVVRISTALGGRVAPGLIAWQPQRAVSATNLLPAECAVSHRQALLQHEISVKRNNIRNSEERNKVGTKLAIRPAPHPNLNAVSLYIHTATGLLL